MASKPQISEITQTQSNIPEWAQPYAAQMMGQAAALTDLNKNPWQQYQGQRFANINPLQQQYMSGVAQLTPSKNFGAANNLTGIAALGGLDSGKFTDEGVASSYMSPYMQNVVNTQKDEAMRDFGRQFSNYGAQASRFGGLGGSRGALAMSEGQRNLQNSLQGIQARGLQDAYSSAQNMFNTDQARRMQGLGLAMQGGQQLGALGEAEFNQGLNALNAQRTAGQDLNAYEQKKYDANYQDFIDMMNDPYKRIGFMSDIVRGQPGGAQTMTRYTRGPNNAAVNANTAAGVAQLAFGG